MAEVHHFAFGWFNPVAAYLMAFLGCLLGLVCTSRARALPQGRHRVRWLVPAAVSIGGGGIWLMHFMAMLGFDVPASAVRYDPMVTAVSLVMAVLTVGVGLFIVGFGRRTVARVLLGGLFTGLGVVAMHYAGMAAMHVNGVVTYDPGLVGASVIIAVLAATIALFFTVTVRGTGAINAAAAVMAVGVSGMHYTAMAAVRIQIFTAGDGHVAGISPFVLVVPITLLAAVALIATAISGLASMTQEEFHSASARRI
ncbi:MAG TPA: MHYT domain-containing protein [Candidatus Limnocylindrales bacterium]